MRLHPIIPWTLLIIYWVLLLAHVSGALWKPSAFDRTLAMVLVISGLPVSLFTAGLSRHRQVEAIRYASLRDDLTGLPGRRLFIDRLSHALQRQERSKRFMAVMLLDLDRFKLVNDSLGHLVGDKLLQMIPQKLSDCLRAGDTLARFGGDEFTILLEDLTSEEEAASIGQRVVAALTQPVQIDGQNVAIGASIGVAICRYPATSAQEIIRCADIALYQAKGKGTGQVVFYEPTLAAPVGRLSLETDLRGAVDRNELCLFYQPEVELSSGRITGFEALVRWRHPRLGLLAPEKFIGVAEELGIIDRIGHWVLGESCAQAKSWQDFYGASHPLKVSVNLSPLEFRQANLLEQVAACLDETGLNGSCLILEITETSLMEENAAVLRTLSALRARGVQIAIDDFGTGYSSLTYLKRFQVDTLKIDQSFLRDIHDERSFSIVEAVVALAHSLKMEVTAEGIENTTQLKALTKLKCDRGQGFLFSQPLDTRAVARLLAEGRHGLRQLDKLSESAVA